MPWSIAHYSGRNGAPAHIGGVSKILLFVTSVTEPQCTIDNKNGGRLCSTPPAVAGQEPLVQGGNCPAAHILPSATHDYVIRITLLVRITRARR